MSAERLARHAEELSRRAAAFRELCRIEPRLAELEGEIRAIKDTGKWFCANEHWLNLKSRMSLLVGWRAENPELRTSKAYDIAYDELYQLLPDCRKCRCIAFEKAMGLSRSRRRV
jgi:hypothetical protein